MKLSLRPSIRNVSLLLAFAASGASLAACGNAPGGSADEGGAEAVGVQQALELHPLGAIRDDQSMMASRQVGVSAPASVPASVDLSAQFPTPGDQGSEGSCVGWATGYAATSFHQAVQEGWSLSPNAHRTSPSWVYNQINGGADNGSYISDAMALIVSKGADDLSDFPYVAGSYTNQPDAASLARAARFKAASWGTLAVSQSNFKSVLAGGNAIVIGIEIFPDWDTLNGTTNTVYDTIAANDYSRGRHAVTIIGYDDARQAFKVINSWGTSWGGNGGYAWIAYSLINNSRLWLDAYVLTDGSNTLVRNGIDSNLDKLNDLVFHNGQTGESQIWYMSGINRTSAANLPAGLNISDATGWTPVAMADFNKDGKADIIWHNGSTGATQAWFMNGATRTGFADFSATLNVTDSTGWRFMGAADFNRDGKPDLFARNLTSGAMQIWLMDGITRSAYVDLNGFLNTPDSTGWQFVGTGDFNQDGQTDIFWHNRFSGQSQVWYMNGSERVGDGAALSSSLDVPESSGWKFSTITDLNHDGKPDLLAHNSATGEFQVWFLDNLTRIGASNLSAGLNTPDSTGWRSLTQ